MINYTTTHTQILQNPPNKMNLEDNQYNSTTGKKFV